MESFRDELIVNHLDYADNMAKRYAGKYKIDCDELKSAAYEGLAVAGSTYDKRKNTDFRTWAYYWIRKKVLQEVDFLESRETVVDDYPDDRENVVDMLLESSTIEQLYSALAELNTNHRKIIVDYYLYGIPHKTIYTEMELPRMTYFRHHKKALSQLKWRLS